MTVDKKKQNILFVHNYYQIPGGEDTVVVNEMKMLEMVIKFFYTAVIMLI